MFSLPDERQQIIKQRLNLQGRVLAADLAREFNTSEDTIRRDLRELAAAGFCRRVYGGALPVSSASGSLAERQAQDPARKLRLGRAAASLVGPGQVVLIDAGSTNLCIAESLNPDVAVTVVTNAPTLAAALIGRPGCEVLMIGGRVDPRIGGSIGARALAEVRNLRADICFLGACALAAATGLSSFDAEEAAFKRVLIQSAERLVVALTNDKLGTVAPFGVAPLDRIDDLVVEADASPALVASLIDSLPDGRLRLHRAAAQNGS